MYSKSIIAWMIFLTSGCMEIQLRDKAVKLSSTATDLYYLQVLDNLARLYDIPESLPYFSEPTQGTNSLQNQVQANYQLGWDLIMGRYLIDKQLAIIQGQRQVAENWQAAPIDDPDTLRLL